MTEFENVEKVKELMKLVNEEVQRRVENMREMERESVVEGENRLSWKRGVDMDQIEKVRHGVLDEVLMLYRGVDD